MTNALLPEDGDEICERLTPVADALEGRAILLSGALGFLGRYFTGVIALLNSRVLRKPCRLIALDNSVAGIPRDAPPSETSSYVLLEDNVIKGVRCEEAVDYVVHMAGIASPRYYRKFPMETLEVAVAGTRNMLEVARSKGARFLFFSSSEVYGDPDPRFVPTPETYRGNVDSLGPRACYDNSKRLGETLCWIYQHQFGVHTNIVRPFNVYGPGMSESDYRVLPNFASRIKGGRPMHVYGSGDQTRTYCYVTDATAGFLRAVTRGKPGEAYNVGNPTPEISVLDLVRRIETVLGRPLDHRLVEHPAEYPADEPMRRCPDIAKARAHLEFEPAVGLDQGLRRYLSWTEAAYTGQRS